MPDYIGAVADAARWTRRAAGLRRDARSGGFAVSAVRAVRRRPPARCGFSHKSPAARVRTAVNDAPRCSPARRRLVGFRTSLARDTVRRGVLLRSSKLGAAVAGGAA